jgi:hypothetical protein
VSELAKRKRSRLRRAWDAFRRQHGSKRGGDVSPGEMEMLSQVALMGEVREPRDFVYILSKLRAVLNR